MFVGFYFIRGVWQRWMIALVLKTRERDERSVGSNPTAPAKEKKYDRTKITKYI